MESNNGAPGKVTLLHLDSLHLLQSENEILQDGDNNCLIKKKL